MDYIVFGLGIFIGFISGVKFIFWQIKKQNNKNQKETEEFFIRVTSGNLTFKQRVNNMVQFLTQNKDYTIVYIMDKKEIAIFEKDNCIAISSSINKEITDKIIKQIESNFKTEINDDIFEINGQKVSKSYFKDLAHPIEEPSDIEAIVEENETRLTLDDILDKILKSGRQSLTEKELEFLHNYSN
jgi:hypothetical protein